MPHLDEGMIHAWLDGQLPPDEAAAAEQHIRECAECSALVAEARGFIAASSRILGALDQGAVEGEDAGGPPHREDMLSAAVFADRAAASDIGRARAAKAQPTRRVPQWWLRAAAGVLIAAIGAVSVNRLVRRDDSVLRVAAAPVREEKATLSRETVASPAPVTPAAVPDEMASANSRTAATTGQSARANESAPRHAPPRADRPVAAQRAPLIASAPAPMPPAVAQSASGAGAAPARALDRRDVVAPTGARMSKAASAAPAPQPSAAAESRPIAADKRSVTTDAAAGAPAPPPSANGVVSGRVTTPEGKPLANAIVGVEGSRIIGKTDTDGRYELRGIPEGERALRARLSGFEPQVRKFAAGDSVTKEDFRLAPSTLQLADVVVTGAGAAQPVKDRASIAGCYYLTIAGLADDARRPATLELSTPFTATLRIGTLTEFGAWQATAGDSVRVDLSKTSLGVRLGLVRQVPGFRGIAEDGSRSRRVALDPCK